MGIAASQLRTGLLLFLYVESLTQSKLQRTTTVGERSIKDMANLFPHQGNRLRVSEVRSQKIALYLHDFLVTGRKR